MCQCASTGEGANGGEGVRAFLAFPRLRDMTEQRRAVVDTAQRQRSELRLLKGLLKTVKPLDEKKVSGPLPKSVSKKSTLTVGLDIERNFPRAFLSIPIPRPQ